MGKIGKLFCMCVCSMFSKCNKCSSEHVNGREMKVEQVAKCVTRKVECCWCLIPLCCLECDHNVTLWKKRDADLQEKDNVAISYWKVWMYCI